MMVSKKKHSFMIRFYFVSKPIIVKALHMNQARAIAASIAKKDKLTVESVGRI